MKYDPIREPGKCVYYGSNAYRVLSYAQFRRNRTFTTTDYRSFTLNKVSSERIREAVNALSELGYLEKNDNPRPTHYNMKNMYVITLSGQHALVYLARKQREREESRKRGFAKRNSNLRWHNERRKIAARKKYHKQSPAV